MAHRHKVHKARGGQVEEVYSGKGSKVVEQAHEKKEGFKKGGKVHGHKGKHRLDKRARGGRIGYKSPFSSARVSEKGNET